MYNLVSTNTSNQSSETQATNVVTPSSSAEFSLSTICIIVLLTITISLCTILGNLLVLASFFVDRNIRTASNYFIASLAITDLLIGLFSMNLFSAYILLGYWPLSSLLCDLWLSLDYTLCLTSQYTVFFITVDRFCSVRIPTRYRNWRTDSRVTIMVAITWIVPSTIFFTLIIGWPYFTRRQRAAGQCNVEFTAYPVFNTLFTLGYFWITLVVMIALYGGIYQVAWSMHRKFEARRRNMSTLMHMASQTMSQIGVEMTWRSNGTVQSAAARKRKVAMFTSKQRCSTIVSHMQQSTSNGSIGQSLRQNLNATPEELWQLRFIDEEAETAATVESESVAENNKIKAPTTSVKSELKETTNKENVPAGNEPKRSGTDPKRSSSNKSVLRVPSIIRHGSTKSTGDIKSNNPEKTTGIIPGGSLKTTIVSTSNSMNPIKTSTVVISLREAARRLKHKRNSASGDTSVKRIENRAKKALRTITFILGAFVTCWTPYHIVILIKSYCDNPITLESCINPHVFNVTYWLCYLNSPINPFCYALATTQFKTAFARILRGDFRRI